MSRKRFQAVKGTRDILPPESALWNRVEQTARKVLETYNYQEIRLPLFEETEVFARSLGVDTDTATKQMFSVVDSDQAFLDQSRGILLSNLSEGMSTQDSKENFVLKFELLVAFLKQAYVEGRIPQSNENLSHLEALHRLVGQWKADDAPFKKDAWHKYCHAIEANLKAVDIGPLYISFRSLRPEATASVVRAYIEHGMHTRPGLVKLYYIGPMFRRERPQKGRYRQFYQIGAEVLGASDHPAIDAEVIEMVLVFIERCGLPAPSAAEGKGAELYVNSIGCGECRPKYVALLKKELEKVKSKLGSDSQRRIETNPLRVLDSKLEDEQPVIAKLPSILDHLCDACRAHFEQVKKELTDRGVAFQLNHRLVRGLDYYMRTTFEITAPGLGAQNAVCGGGRYDGLVELLGGPPTKGIGWALGTDRLVLALEQSAAALGKGQLDVFVLWLGEPAYVRARELARKLRDAGLSVELPYEEMKMKKALSRADQLGARYALILGEDELRQGTVTLRDLAAGSQRSLPEPELLKELKQPRMNTDEH